MALCFRVIKNKGGQKSLAVREHRPEAVNKFSGYHRIYLG